MSEIILPNNWEPRVYQTPLWQHLENGGRRAYEVAHRRWGKDDVCLHYTATAAMQRVGNYWHMLPQANQAKKAVWNAINSHTGKRRIDEAFPLSIRKRTNNNEMLIEFVNGSIWQVLGSDNYDSLVGSPPVGVVFSEWALANPAAWPYIQPILEENGGWAFFITTPRGRNHAKSFYEMAEASDEWYCEKQTVADTNVFTAEQLKRIEQELIAGYGIDEGKAKFQQEYYCSFDAALPGAYYGTEMVNAEAQGRICSVPYVQGEPVYVTFDLGWGDSTSMWFWQIIGREPRVIDYHESSGGSIPAYAQFLNQKPYLYGKLILPHDGEHGRLSTGMSYAKQFRDLGFTVATLSRAASLDIEIKLTRQFIPMVWFDKEKAKQGLECLRSYHREWDNKNKCFKQHPKHDWASNGADGFRTGAIAHKEGLMKPTTVTKKPMMGSGQKGNWMSN